MDFKKTFVQYSCFTSLGKQHYHEGMFKVVKRWDKYMNAYGDYVKNKHYYIVNKFCRIQTMEKCN
jgi:hypothetical protein